MTALEFKTSLFQKLEKVSDITILQAISEIFDLGMEKSKQNHWDTLSDDDKEAIQEGINQLDNGEFVSDEEMRRKIKSKFQFL